MIFKRKFINTLLSRLKEPAPLIQAILGPRQVGKTTAIRQLLADIQIPFHYCSADLSISLPSSWIIEQWQEALLKGEGSLLVIDEIQKISNWSELLKKLWDDSISNKRIKVIILGSSSLKIQKGLTESLTGRFELIRVFHWSFSEYKEAFGCDLNSYLQYGGYPGSFEYINDYSRWHSYIKDSVIETVIGQDILSLTSVSNPALFRQAFEILSSYPAQEISYNKLLGQLQDRGNTDLVKKYIELYEGAFLFRALEKYSNKATLRKSSTPKILPLCPCLATVHQGKEALADNEFRGRLFELAVGADLNRLQGELYYWREGSNEVDYIYKLGKTVWSIEVKSGRKKSVRGLEKFTDKFPKARMVIVNSDNYESFSADPENFLERLR